MKISFIPIFAIAFLSGCASRYDNIPGSIEPGTVDSVSRRSEAGSGINGFEPTNGMGVIALNDNVKPVIPLIYGPTVKSCYFFRNMTNDKRAIRDGFFAHIKIKDSEWGAEKAMYEDRLNLQQLTNMHVDPKTNRVIIDHIENPTDHDTMRELSSIGGNIKGSMGGGLNRPWIEGGDKENGRKITVITDDGKAFSTQSPIGNGPSMPSPSGMWKNGDVNSTEVEDAIKRAQQAVEGMKK